MLKPEQIDHINIVNWFNYNFPELEPDFHHFANERKCSIAEGRTLKRMGVKRGVADFFLAIPVKEYSGLWIELKSNNGKLSPEQKLFLERKRQRGYQAVTCWGFEETKAIILIYLCDYVKNDREFVPKNEYKISTISCAKCAQNEESLFVDNATK